MVWHSPFAGWNGLDMGQLKLIALDKEDLGILSTYCQDAVVKIGDLEYLPNEKRFVIVMNRFAWDTRGKGQPLERRRSVLHFNRVESVKITGINRNQPDNVLSLLAVTFEPGEPPSGNLHLVFSGEATLRLQVECIEVQLSDMEAAWKAKSQPAHQLD